MVNLLMLTGGISLVGAWIYRQLGNKAERFPNPPQTQAAGPTWGQTGGQSSRETLQRGFQHFTWRKLDPTEATAVSMELPLRIAHRVDDSTAAIPYALRASAMALGVTTVGQFVFPPLQVAGVPLLLYMGIPAARAAYDQLWVNGRPSRALTETVVLAVCLAGSHYWVGALGFWLYYGGRSLLAAQPVAELMEPPTLNPTTAQLWKEGAVSTVAVAALQPGDQVILHSGEMVPVDGLIVEGAGWLRPTTSPTIAGLHKGVGDQVTATEIVLVGRLCMRVRPIA